MRKLSIPSVGAILALTSVTSAAPAMQPLKISKECSQYSGEAPSFCTITESNIAAIPAGTKVFYCRPVLGSPLFSSSSSVVIAVGKGDSAIGYCVIDETASPPHGTCAFHAGSGALAAAA
jgi:hypothetical protein